MIGKFRPLLKELLWLQRLQSVVAAIARLHGGRLELRDNRPGLRAALVLPAAAGRARTRVAAGVRRAQRGAESRERRPAPVI